MSNPDTLALEGAPWKSEYLEDTSLRHLVLDYYDAEHVALERYLLFLGTDSETAKEIVQDCFLKLHEHLLANRDRSHLRAWLYRVAHNLAHNTRTSSHTTRTLALPDLSSGAEPVAPVVSVEEQLLEEERFRIVRQGFERLSSSQRNCLVLRSQGLKYREIADVLDLSVSAVAENIQRALAKLRDLL